jgi:hypothetical protein
MHAADAMRLIEHNRWVISPRIGGGWTIDTQSGEEVARSESRYLVDAVELAMRNLDALRAQARRKSEG